MLMLNTMQNWCKKWRLKVNTAKTNIVHFRTSRTPKTDFNFMYDDEKLTIVPEYKYLGVIMDEHLNFNSCSKTLAESGGRALSAIISRLKSHKDVGFKSFTKVYDACVVPVTDYGSGVWGKFNVKHSDLVQNRACRYFLGVHNFTPIPALQAEIGWLPPKYRKYLNMLRLWNRLIKMSNDRLTKRIFLMDYFRCSSNWCDQIKSVFQMLDALHIYDNKESCDLTYCKNKFIELFEKECMENITNKPKLRTYKLFKQNCNTPDYVTGCLNRCERSLLAKFRCGILQLKIETGRFDNTKLEDRICEFCDESKIEDEFHFLIECNLYNDLRKVLFTKVRSKNSIFETLSLKEKFIFLLKNCNYHVARFIKDAWNMRKLKLYAK